MSAEAVNLRHSLRDFRRKQGKEGQQDYNYQENLDGALNPVMLDSGAAKDGPDRAGADC